MLCHLLLREGYELFYFGRRKLPINIYVENISSCSKSSRTSLFTSYLRRLAFLLIQASACLGVFGQFLSLSLVYNAFNKDIVEQVFYAFLKLKNRIKKVGTQ